jgi:hypothetical protein
MYTPICGRPSGLLHLAVQYPKISACVVALGLGGTAGWSTLSASNDVRIARYCNAPTEKHLAALPASLRSKIDEACACLSNKCSVRP